MKVTHNTIQVITNALRVKTPRMTQEALALELGKSKSWVSKLLSGSIKQIDEEVVELLEHILSIKLQVLSLGVSGVAAQIDSAMKSDPNLATAFMAMLEVSTKQSHYSLPFIPTNYLIELGEVANRASHANPTKDGKIGRIIIEKLTEILSLMEEQGELTFGVDVLDNS